LRPRTAAQRIARIATAADPDPGRARIIAGGAPGLSPRSGRAALDWAANRGLPPCPGPSRGRAQTGRAGRHFQPERLPALAPGRGRTAKNCGPPGRAESPRSCPRLSRLPLFLPGLRRGSPFDRPASYVSVEFAPLRWWSLRTLRTSFTTRRRWKFIALLIGGTGFGTAGTMSLTPLRNGKQRGYDPRRTTCDGAPKWRSEK